MKRFAIMAILVFFASQSQGTVGDGGMGYFMLGKNVINLDDLNSKLENAGYAKCSDDFLFLGGGGHGIHKKWIIGGEGGGLIGKEKEKGGYKTRVDAGYGFFNLGYILYSTEKMRVYPLLGIGGGGISLKITEKDSRSFDDVITDPKKSVELSTGGFLLNLSIGTDYLHIVGGDKEGEEGPAFGLRAGYILPISMSDWSANDTEISGGPKMGITGPYIHLMFGGGGRHK